MENWLCYERKIFHLWRISLNRRGGSVVEQLNQSYYFELKDRVAELEEEKKLLEESLEAIQSIYKQMEKPMILLHKKDKKIIDANPAACELFQMTRKQLLMKSLHEFLYLDPKDIIDSQDQIIREKGILRDEMILELKDGTIKNIVFHAFANIREDADLYILSEVDTPIKMLEWERTMHLHSFSNLFSQIIDGLIMFNNEGKIVQANPAFCDVVGIKKEELIGKSFKTFIPKRDLEKYKRCFQKLYKEGSFFGEIRIQVKNKIKKFEVSVSSNVFHGLYMAILRDITEKHEMEKKILESERKFRKIFNGAMSGMMIWKDAEDCDDKPIIIQELNETAKNLFQLKNKKDYTEQLKTIKLTNQNNLSLLKAIQWVAHKKLNLCTYEVELNNGTRKSIEMFSKRNILPGIHLSVFHDVTHRIQMEEQLKKSDTLNIVGELAAGIAHEIRNPLTSLKGFIQLLKGDINGYDTYFNIIMSELERIESIVHEFLVLAKPQAINYKYFNVIKIMQETIDLLSPQALMDNVELRTYFKERVMNTYCEPNHIKQVFINIVKNAIEATVENSTSEKIIHISIHQTEDHWIKVVIQDSGKGISKEKLKRLGEPFYTTKEKGTGLGLMISYKIIKEHGGKIEVASQMNKGTTFSIYLPINQS